MKAMHNTPKQMHTMNNLITVQTKHNMQQERTQHNNRSVQSQRNPKDNIHNRTTHRESIG